MMFRTILVSPAYIIGMRDNKAQWGFFAAIDGVKYMIALSEYTLEEVRKKRDQFINYALSNYKRVRTITHSTWNTLFGTDWPDDALTLAELVSVAKKGVLPT